MKLILALILSLAAAAPSPGLAAEAGDHRHHAAPARLELDHGNKWPTDAPLRKGMMEMRKAFGGKLHAIHAGTLRREDYLALGKSVDTQVGMIVSQCKLAPDADAMLHIVIAELIGAAEVMQEKTPGDAAGAAHRAVAALNQYGAYFAHPGWRPLQ